MLFSDFDVGTFALHSLSISGPMVLDEATEVIKSVCHGNSNAIGLVLLPVDHASIHHVTVVRNRRSLEDRLMQILVGFMHG